MKRVLSFILAIATVMSAFILIVDASNDADGQWVPENDRWDALSRDGVKARFAIGADIHFDYFNSARKNRYVYHALKQIGGVDAYLIAGDLTHYASDSNYKDLMASVNTYTAKNRLNPDATGDSVPMTVLAMGNHEGWYESDVDDPEAQFRKYVKQEPDDLYWIGGVPVIKLSPDAASDRKGASDGNCYDGSEDFLEGAYAEIDSAGYVGPIIIIAHHRTEVDGTSNDYWSKNAMRLMRAHPNTVIFTGHSHTWIGGIKQFVLQDAGFTHVRAGSLGNHYGGLGSGYINPSTGKTTHPLSVSGDSGCSFVLVDVMDDGNIKLRRIDLAKGEYMFEDEPVVIRPGVLTDYLYDDETAGWAESYGAGSIAPSFPEGGNVIAERVGDSTIRVSFPEAVAASSLSRDFVAEYRIRVSAVVMGEDGKVTYRPVMNGEREYFRVANYRAKADEGKDWSVTIRGLAWDTDYVVEVRAYNAYGKATAWTAAERETKRGAMRLPQVDDKPMSKIHYWQNEQNQRLLPG
ncbi:MAG: metallophosphoesterase [Clostridia bacterium]|nr:metallophosphoesterase [Clostridia bacterium]